MALHRARVVGAGLLLLAGLFLSPGGASAQNCGDFPDGGPLSGTVNTYYTGRGTANAGDVRIRLWTTSPTFPIRGSADRIAAGDMLLVIQMQDANINSTNSNVYGDGIASDPANGQTALNSAGYFENVVANSAPDALGWVDIIGAGTGNGLIHTYRTATGATPRRLFQVVRVPRYKTATLSSSLTASVWDGTNGGIIAIDVTGTLTLGGTVSVDGQGFRGGAGRQLAGGAGLNTDYRTAGTVNNNGPKGEGIVGTPRWIFNGTANVNTGVEGYPNGSQARGGPGNAGGGGTDDDPANNDENSGGGGGGNGGQGGYGGYCFSNAACPGRGNPGAAFPYSVGANARMVMGGGGGAGSRNNSAGFQSAGGLGGGVVIIRATTVTGTGIITANGRGRDIAGITPANDGGGGGGAGGTVVVVVATGNLSGLTVQARGGGGADAWPTQAPGGTPGNRHGPGGGGGGGIVLLSSAALSVDVSGGVSGTTTTVFDPFGATAGSVGAYSSTVTMNDIPGVQSCNSFLPTRATIRGLRVYPSGLVEFATGSQQGSIAFQIWQTWDPAGRKDRELLTEIPVATLPAVSIEPIVYKLRTRPITAPFLLIEEVEAGGARRMMGPFPVSDERLEEELRRVEERMAGGGTSAARSVAPMERSHRKWPSEMSKASGAIKIEVSAAGVVRVPAEDLIAMGLPEGLLAAADRLRLTSLGRPVPFQVVPGPTGSAALQFVSDLLSTDYTGTNVYVLWWQGSAPPPPSVGLTRSGFTEHPGMVRIERNVFYAPFVAREADPWIWGFLVSSQPPEPFAFDVLSLAEPGADPVPVRIGLCGGSDHRHTVRAWINGQEVGAVSLEGKSPGEIAGSVSPGSVRSTGNQLTFQYSATLSSPDDAGLVFLDVVDLGVPVQQAPAEAAVDRLAPYDPHLPNFRGASYLILTHGLFEQGAAQIAEQKRREGYRTVVVDVERAYDRYSAGVVEANAVRKLISDARREGRKRLKYVLLVGDDTFDPRDFLGRGQVSFIPSLNGWDGSFGRVPSENLYADTNGDGAPELAIGRLPVSTVEEMGVIVEKLARQYELLAAGKRRQLIATDNQGPGDPSFRKWGEEMEASLPSRIQVAWADVGLDAASARAALLQGLQEGVEATHYFGHGGFEMWTDDGLLSVDDAAGFANSGVGSVLFAWTCEAQWYQYHLGPSINEALFLVPGGGAVAAFGPTGITDAAAQRLLSNELYANLRPEASLGEAIRRAKRAAVRASDAARPVVEGWNLFGDPALRLKWGSRP